MSKFLRSLLGRFYFGTHGRMIRVATSLCRLVFEKAKVNDALLFMTILSTDLKALKRRGYNGQYSEHTCPRVARLIPAFHSGQDPQATTTR